MIRPTNNPTYTQVRVVGMVSLAYHILARCCKEISGYPLLFHHKGKFLTKGLLNFTLPIIREVNSQDNIDEYFEHTKQKIDRDDLIEDRQIHMECLEDLIDIFMTKNTATVFETTLLLRNIKEGKKVYTQNEVDILNEK